MSDIDDRMPPDKRGPVPGSKQFQAGRVRSVRRLMQLDFDPIKELVDKYRKLEEEVKIHEGVRDGSVVQLRADGKPKVYNHEAHMAVYDRLLKVGEALLRYGYGRVPEQAAPPPPALPTLTVTLTKKGDVYTVNEQNDVLESDEEND